MKPTREFLWKSVSFRPRQGLAPVDEARCEVVVAFCEKLVVFFPQGEVGSDWHDILPPWKLNCINIHMGGVSKNKGVSTKMDGFIVEIL